MSSYFQGSNLAGFQQGGIDERALRFFDGGGVLKIEEGEPWGSPSFSLQAPIFLHREVMWRRISTLAAVSAFAMAVAFAAA